MVSHALTYGPLGSAALVTGPRCSAASGRMLLTLADSSYAPVNSRRLVCSAAPQRAAVSVDAVDFREALGRFASGVCVVTTVGADGRPAGVTISAFASLSLAPPMVLFCIGKRSSNLEAWLVAPHFSVNVLSESQEGLSELFASQAPDKCAGVAGSIGGNGCFRLDGALVTLECRRTRLHDEGDHYIVVGLVERVVPGSDAGPLLRFRAAYRQIAAAT